MTTRTVNPRPTWRWLLAACLLAALLLVTAAEWLVPAWRKSGTTAARSAQPGDPGLVARGAYLARLGNCAQCHTAKGGPAFAGGDALVTPFGRVYPGNLTPHPVHGLGAWTAADFRRAMHQGIGPDGRVLNPAFPYTSYTRISQDESDALFAYLRSLDPVEAANKPHELPWFMQTQTALLAWRLLHFTEAPEHNAGLAVQTAVPSTRRGAELAQGLGHCTECHTPRNRLGGLKTSAAWSGGLMPDGSWYAPALNNPAEAGMSGWSAADITKLLRHGQQHEAYATGPMAEVVRNSTQYLTESDAQSLALYLQTLAPAGSAPAHSTPPTATSAPLPPLGARIYDNECAQCHGKRGEGVANAYPALAGNRAVLMDNIHNPVLMVLRGAYGPSTSGKPEPFGMPPYQLTLSDAEVAAVLTHIRKSWGNDAAPVTEFDINTIRNSPLR